KQKTFLLLILGAAWLISPSKALAQVDFPEANGSLCLPGLAVEVDSSCQTLGPTGYLARMQASGIFFPLVSLPARFPDASLAELPFYYGKIKDREVPTYASPADAVAGATPKRYIEQGLNYVTYIDYMEYNNSSFYMVAPGEWVQKKDISVNIVSSKFTGLEFFGTPANDFGWVLFTVQSQKTPGLSNQVMTGNEYFRFNVITVYETIEKDGVRWHMIGPDEWIEGRFSALVYPVFTSPEGVVNGRWIEMNLFEQTVSVYQDNHLVYATLVTSGQAGWWTRPGLFQIYEKLESTLMQGAFEADRSDYYYLEDVPWTMYFDQKRAFHGTYWHNNFGFENSHGCANLSPGDSRWLFDWALLGDSVYIWDPSGQTPTDPSLYTAGGA
ncbi:MAG: L,D-transpeptidase, partial [Chloroflexota bacterium]